MTGGHTRSSVHVESTERQTRSHGTTVCTRCATFEIIYLNVETLVHLISAIVASGDATDLFNLFSSLCVSDIHASNIINRAPRNYRCVISAGLII